MATSTIKGKTQSEKNTSYGNIIITEQDGIVNIRGYLSGLPTSAWATITSDLPMPSSSAQGIMPDGSATNFTVVTVSTAGALSFYGRGSVSTCHLNLTYAI